VAIAVAAAEHLTDKFPLRRRRADPFDTSAVSIRVARIRRAERIPSKRRQTRGLIRSTNPVKCTPTMPPKLSFLHHRNRVQAIAPIMHSFLAPEFETL
jgi:hypothetical protein